MWRAGGSTYPFRLVTWLGCIPCDGSAHGVYPTVLTALVLRHSSGQRERERQSLMCEPRFFVFFSFSLIVSRFFHTHTLTTPSNDHSVLTTKKKREKRERQRENEYSPSPSDIISIEIDIVLPRAVSQR